jgi:chromosome segregation ATPase
MSEPITPKAEHHVVEGEFVEAETSHEAPKDKAAKSSENKARAKRAIPWLWLAVMGVSGAAFALALAAWLEVKNPSPGLVAAIDQQQVQIQDLDKMLAAKQQTLDELQQAFQTQQQALADLSAQAEERGLMIAQLQQQPPQADGSDAQSAAPVEPSSVEVPANQTDELKQKLAQAEQQTQQALADLQQQIQRLSEQGAQQFDQAQDYVQSEQWQQDKQALQAELEQMQQQVQTLMQQQAEWVAKVRPLFEQTAEDIKPQLEGIMSRFNQIFTIKKHQADETTQETQPEQAVVKPEAEAQP